MQSSALYLREEIINLKQKCHYNIKINTYITKSKINILINYILQ